MIVMDTDTFSLFASGHPRVTARFAKAEEEVTITLVTRIEALEGRFAFLLRAEDGADLIRAQEWLRRTDMDLAPFPPLLFTDVAAAEFDRLRHNKKSEEDRPKRFVDRLYCLSSSGDAGNTQPARLSARAGPAIGELGRLKAHAEIGLRIP